MPRSGRLRFGRRRRRGWVAGAVPLILVLLILVGWVVDTRLASGKVLRHVTLAGHSVGGTSRDGLRSMVEQLARDEQARAVHVVTAKASYDTDAATLGVAVDVNATVDAVMQVGRSDALPLRPLRWATSLVSDRTVRPRYTVDRDVLALALPGLEGDARTPPVEPGLKAVGDGPITVAAGKPGNGIPTEALARALLAAAPSSATPIQARVDDAPLNPQFSDAQAQTVAQEADGLARRGLTVTIGSASKPLPVATVAAWLRAVPADGALKIAIDEAAVRKDLGAMFAGTDHPAADASFTIEGGKPVLHPSQQGTTCCEAGAGQKVLDALRQKAGGVTIGLTTSEPALTTEQATALGIIEEVGQPAEFGPTTHHPGGESRVTNIHKIADIVRGHVIKPGDTFSVNDFVGMRTAEKGFVDAPVIYNSVHDHDIGGGVSQFATTLFNASFFAGLDIPEYQSHSLIISRYPTGREATISWPKPDLKIKNTTPYGVLIWPTYDDTTITVHLFSTHNVDAVAEPTTSAPAGPCTRVTTPRTRTYIDKTVKHDTFGALYQPAEGVQC
jgi:vancomycin resistance protein YoaR